MKQKGDDFEYSYIRKRRLNREFRQRYNAMSEEEKKKFDKEVDNLGCIIGIIVFIISVIVIFIKEILASD